MLKKVIGKGKNQTDSCCNPAYKRSCASCIVLPALRFCEFFNPVDQSSLVRACVHVHIYARTRCRPTWLDQTWFAYTGLKTYSQVAGASALADDIKARVFQVGSGFKLNDTVPLNEHYDAQTGKALGTTHFSWTAAHVLMWSLEEKAKAEQNKNRRWT